jgi:hypothetical protein
MFLGLDYDKEYIETCKSNILESKIKNCDIIHASIYDYKGGPFDAIYFSGITYIILYYIIN